MTASMVNRVSYATHIPTLWSQAWGIRRRIRERARKQVGRLFLIELVRSRKRQEDSELSQLRCTDLG